MGDRDTNWSRDVLEHIVVLLFALADLADLAAGLPCHRRRHVLGILSHGEAEARAFLIGDAAPALADASESAADAVRLALRLRALALLLCAMLAGRFALPGAAGPRAGRLSHRISGPVVRRLAASPVPDTS